MSTDIVHMECGQPAMSVDRDMNVVAMTISGTKGSDVVCRSCGERVAIGEYIGDTRVAALDRYRAKEGSTGIQGQTGGLLGICRR